MPELELNGPYGFVGTPQLVDGGLLYQPAKGREAYFLGDDGKVTTLTIPSGASVRNALRVGKAWILADSYHGNAQLFWSSDGKQWSRKDWGLDVTGNVLLGLVEGTPTLSLTRGRPAALFALGASPANDPPEPVAVDASSVDGVCDAHASAPRVAAPLAAFEPQLRARVEVPKAPAASAILRAWQRVTHVTRNGKLRTSAYMLRGSDPRNSKTTMTSTSRTALRGRGCSSTRRSASAARPPNPKESSSRNRTRLKAVFRLSIRRLRQRSPVCSQGRAPFQ